MPAAADGSASKAGLSTATAADAFTKKQWEVVQRLKINYQDQVDKKNKKEEKLRRAEKRGDISHMWIYVDIYISIVYLVHGIYIYMI